MSKVFDVGRPRPVLKEPSIIQKTFRTFGESKQRRLLCAQISWPFPARKPREYFTLQQHVVQDAAAGNFSASSQRASETRPTWRGSGTIKRTHIASGTVCSIKICIKRYCAKAHSRRLRFALSALKLTPTLSFRSKRWHSVTR